MKKAKIFGRSIPVLAIVAIVASAGLASAALVGYLSNTIEATVTVESPIEQKISLSMGNWADSITLDDIRGGETITFYTRTANLADVPITGIGKNIVTCPAGVTPADFELVRAKTQTEGGEYSDWYGLTGTVVNWQTVKFAYGPEPSITWSEGQVDITKIVVTFKSDARGTYTFTSQIVP